MQIRDLYALVLALHSALSKTTDECRSELEQRMDSGMDEEWEGLNAVVIEADEALSNPLVPEVSKSYHGVYTEGVASIDVEAYAADIVTHTYVPEGDVLVSDDNEPAQTLVDRPFIIHYRMGNREGSTPVGDLVSAVGRFRELSHELASLNAERSEWDYVEISHHGEVLERYPAGGKSSD